MKNKIERLPDAELDIMIALWNSTVPMRAGDIVRKLSETRSWKTQTAHVLLNRLCDKGFISADKDDYYHRFSPIITEEEYKASESDSLLKRIFGGSVKTMLASLIDTDKVTDDDILELTEMLEKKRAEIKDRSDEQ